MLLKRFDVSHQDAWMGRMGGGKTNLDVELERVPNFNVDRGSVRLV
jgi:hypothetical protein